MPMTVTEPQESDFFPDREVGAPAAPQTQERLGYRPDVSLIDVLWVLLNRWRLVVGFPMAASFAVLAISFFVRPTYTALTTFIPQARQSARLPGGLAGIAGQLGISLGDDGGQSPRFYAQVSKSRSILERLLLTRFPDPRTATNSADSSTLLQILEVKGRDWADSLDNGVERLSRLLSVRVDQQTGIVSVWSSSRYPELAAAVANTLVSYLNDFNTHTRRSQARERRRFAELRAAEAERELRGAEESLRSFYETNHLWEQSPTLRFEEARLRRRVELRQELLLTLRREHETARIEEVNDTPVITVIDTAVAPQKKSSPRRTLWALFTLVVTGFGSVIAAFVADYFDRARRRHEVRYLRLAETAARLRHELTDGARNLFSQLSRKGR